MYVKNSGTAMEISCCAKNILPTLFDTVRFENITLQQAYDEDKFPHVLVSPQMPFVVHMEKEPFKTKFGRTVRNPLFFDQISTDESLAFLLNCSHGKMIKGQIPFQQSQSRERENENVLDVLCVPMLEMPSCTVRYLLVFFEVPKDLFANSFAESGIMNIRKWCQINGLVIFYFRWLRKLTVSHACACGA
jgi:hypothetical protein